MRRIEIIALPDFPLVEPGDDLSRQIVESLDAGELNLRDGDVLVIAQKIISKAESRYAYLRDVVPSIEAQQLASKTDKDPRLVQLILNESVEVIKHRPGAIIVEHKLGYVHANAGIDQSNISSDGENPRVLLLPQAPDISAAQLRQRIKDLRGVDVAIVVNDSAGRAWRNGTVGFAIGTAGFEPLENMIGQMDLFGRPMEVTQVAVADELAAAGSFLMGQADESIPVVVIRGANIPVTETGSQSLIRTREQDLFR